MKCAKPIQEAIAALDLIEMHERQTQNQVFRPLALKITISTEAAPLLNQTKCSLAFVCFSVNPKKIREVM